MTAFSFRAQDNLENETIQFQESLGILKLGERINNISKILGKPDQKTKTVMWEGDGLKHQTWQYTNRGIVLDVVVEKNPKMSWINMITIHEPCSFKTQKNIGIGSTRSEIENQYAGLINDEESGEEQIILGSIYGGIIFSLEEDRVKSIFFGSSAE